MVYAKKEQRQRADSNISENMKTIDLEIKDKEHCILCFNQLRFFALGQCDHKNVCHTCSLRLRIILEDEQCPICKAELDEILITEDKEMTWSFFDKKLRKKCEEDPEDDSIYYQDEEAKKNSLSLRNLNCMIYNCQSSK